MTRTERESLERLAALTEALEEPGVWICQDCSYVALYARPQRIHERNTTHAMRKEEKSE